MEAQWEKLSFKYQDVQAVVLTTQTSVERSLDGQDGEGCARPGLLTRSKRGRWSAGLPHMIPGGEFPQKLHKGEGKGAGSAGCKFQACATDD